MCIEVKTYLHDLFQLGVLDLVEDCVSQRHLLVEDSLVKQRHQDLIYAFRHELFC